MNIFYCFNVICVILLVFVVSQVVTNLYYSCVWCKNLISIFLNEKFRYFVVFSDVYQLLHQLDYYYLFYYKKIFCWVTLTNIWLVTGFFSFVIIIYQLNCQKTFSCNPFKCHEPKCLVRHCKTHLSNLLIICTSCERVKNTFLFDSDTNIKQPFGSCETLKYHSK